MALYCDVSESVINGHGIFAHATLQIGRNEQIEGIIWRQVTDSNTFFIDSRLFIDIMMNDILADDVNRYVINLSHQHETVREFNSYFMTYCLSIMIAAMTPSTDIYLPSVM